MKETQAHPNDGCPACAGGMAVYQSPIIIARDQAWQALKPDDTTFKTLEITKKRNLQALKTRLREPGSDEAKAIAPLMRNYLSQCGEEELERLIPGALKMLAKDKAALADITSESSIGKLDASLVEHFIENRKGAVVDVQHRVFSFFERFLHRRGSGEHEEGAELATRPDLIGVSRRYISNLLSHPGKAHGARLDILTYLLPNLIANNDSPGAQRLTALMAASLSDEVLEQIVKPDFFKAKLTESPESEISVSTKDLNAEYGSSKTVQINFSKDTKFRYMGKEWQYDHSHGHIGRPEHEIASTKKEAADWRKGANHPHYNGEIHHVFKNGNQFFVVTSPLQLNPADNFKNPDMDAVLDIHKGGKAGRTDSLARWLGSKEIKAHTYAGGLTTKDYKSGVIFAVTEQPVEISRSNYDYLCNLAGGIANSRAPQQPMGRRAVSTAIENLLVESQALAQEKKSSIGL